MSRSEVREPILGSAEIESGVRMSYRAGSLGRNTVIRFFRACVLGAYLRPTPEDL